MDRKMSSVPQKSETPRHALQKLTGLILKFNDHTNRTEDLFLYNLHVRLGVSEYRRIDEISLAPESITTSLNSSSLLFARFDVGHDTLAVFVNFFFFRGVKVVILTSY